MVDLSEATLRGIRCAADIIRGCRKGAALTGAGISTPSGIPDFRSTTSGLWEKYDPYEVASLSSFRTHPEKFFNWLRPLAQGMRAAQPNQAHLALAHLERDGFIKAIITQNIDGLHQRAGSSLVLEVHGSMESLTCTSCYLQVDARDYFDSFLNFGEIPHCPDCRNILKPDAILFGEQLPVRTWINALDFSQKCDLMIVAGSSLEVLPVASLPMRALENGAHLVVINQTPTYIDVRADVVLNGNVAEIIPRILSEVMGG